MEIASAVPRSMQFRTFSALALLLCVGCGQGLPVAPVSGTITFQNKPLVGASITTQPIATDSRNPGLGSFGWTDDQGHFELELVKPAMKGAIIGEHRVMISPAAGDTTKNQPQRSADGEYQGGTDDPQGHRRVVADRSWPAQFTDGSLRLQVPPQGTSDVRFDLTP
jgi:hypothetical protein